LQAMFPEVVKLPAESMVKSNFGAPDELQL